MGRALSAIGQKIGDGLNDEAAGLLLLVHERSEIPQVSGQQMGAAPRHRRLEDRLVFSSQACQWRHTKNLRRAVQLQGKFSHRVHRIGEFHCQIAPALLQRVFAGQQCPALGIAKQESGLALRSMRRSEYDVGIQK